MTIKEYHSKYFNKIQQDKNKKQEEIIQIALQAVSKAIKEKNKFNWVKVENDIINKMYDSLAKTLGYSLTLVKEAYKIKDKQLNLKDLTWQKDGKTIEDRINEYCYSIAQLIELEEIPNESKLKQILAYKLIRLLNTETMTIHNNFVWQLLNKEAKYVEIWNEDDQCDTDCGCDAYFNHGKFLLTELEELPPYHPDCECYLVYYF